MSEELHAEGNSEGAIKGWETRKLGQIPGEQKELEQTGEEHAQALEQSQGLLNRSKRMQREVMPVSEAKKLRDEHLQHAANLQEKENVAEAIVRKNSNPNRDEEYKQQATEFHKHAGAHESAASKLESDYGLDELQSKNAKQLFAKESMSRKIMCEAQDDAMEASANANDRDAGNRLESSIA